NKKACLITAQRSSAQALTTCSPPVSHIIDQNEVTKFPRPQSQTSFSVVSLTIVEGLSVVSQTKRESDTGWWRRVMNSGRDTGVAKPNQRDEGSEPGSPSFPNLDVHTLEGGAEF
ncbi:hypothetical protein MPER_12980, partial [Moniliophthora perniciosa FA553]